MLQLLDILRGWAIFNFGGVITRRGRSCRKNPIRQLFATNELAGNVDPTRMLLFLNSYNKTIHG
jgi:hypothetical protein